MKMMTRAMATGLVMAMGAGAAMAEGPRAGMEREPMTREMALERAAEKFDAADKDGDGVLSREEMREMRASYARDGGKRGGGKHGGGKMGGGKMDAEKRAKILERFDTDGDGKLSEEERAAMRAAMAEKRPARY